MKRIFLLLALCATFNNVVIAQGYLLLTNDQQIEFDGFKTYETYLEVDLAGKGKVKRKVAIDSVVGFYEKESEIFYHRKPSTIESEKIKYQFIERYIPGRITVYREIRLHTTQQGSFSSTSYYMEKGGSFKEALHTSRIGQGKEDQLEDLKAFLADNPAVLKEVGDDFKFTPRNLVDIVRKYNFAALDSAAPSVDTTCSAEVIIYKRKKSKEDKNIQLSVDGKKLTWPSSNVLVFRVTPDVYTRVCIGDKEQRCEVVEASRHYATYFKLDTSEDPIDFLERQTKNGAVFDFKMMRYKR